MLKVSKGNEKGKKQIIVFRASGQSGTSWVVEGPAQGEHTGHHPQSPQYLAHPIPHAFSLSRVRILVSSCSPSLSANKHPKIPAGEICPLQQWCEQEERERVSGREWAEPWQTQRTHHSELLRQAKGREESGWCWAGEDEMWIWCRGEAQVSLPGAVTAFWGG